MQVSLQIQEILVFVLFVQQVHIQHKHLHKHPQLLVLNVEPELNQKLYLQLQKLYVFHVKQDKYHLQVQRVVMHVPLVKHQKQDLIPVVIVAQQEL